MALFGRKKGKTDLSPYHLTFGEWQDEPIEWCVLAKDGDKAYLISERAVEGMYFNKDFFQGNDFETSDIRWWLNSPFKKGAFSPEEAEKIVGDISMLSLKEMKDYFPRASVSRVCLATEYAKTKDIACEQYAGMLGVPPDACMWWLRTPARMQTDVIAVGFDGSLFEGGFGVIAPKVGVRPTMWIKL